MFRRFYVRLALPDASASQPRFLITGACGQIGSELSAILMSRFGSDRVICTDFRKPTNPALYKNGLFRYVDVLNQKSLEQLVVDHGITHIIHNAAIMSVKGESDPHQCLDVNVDGLRNVLECCRLHNLSLFAPSTMAVFSEESGKVMTKDDCVLNPTTIYGITKVFLEQLGAYYNRRFGVDFRSIRYPGIISSDTVPGGGTTDYAVWMYHNAVDGREFVCPVDEHEPLPMMYMPDCLEGTVQLILAPNSALTRNTYNLSAFSFTPAQLAESIRKIIPDFKLRYERGIQQTIAHSWPDSIDSSNATKDWGWQPKWDLDAMTRDMIYRLRLARGTTSAV